MRLPLLVSASVVLTAAAAPVAAQDMDWTGFYAGGRLGYTAQPKDNGETVRFDTDLNGTFDDTVNTAGGVNAFARGFCGGAATGARTTGCYDKDGTEWAVHAGFDYQLGRAIVVGAAADYGRSTIEDSVTAFSSTPAFYTFTRELRDHAGLRGRAGATIGNTLAYGTGGLAWGKIRRSFATSNAVNTVTETAGDDDAWGYSYGGGIEHRVSQNFSIGAQYLYTSLKDDDGSTVRIGGANVPVSNPFILRNAQGTDLRRSSERFTRHNISVVASFPF